MSTGTSIIQSALSKIGAHSIVKPANPESVENGRRKLNSYISRLRDDNIIFNAVPLITSGDELSEPDGLTSVIEDNLAILLQPDHPGTQISPQLRVNAVSGQNYMTRKYRTRSIPKQVRRNTMPLGQGNSYAYARTRIFADDEKSEVMQITNKMVQGEINDFTESFANYLDTGETISSFTATPTVGLIVASSSETNGVISYRMQVLITAIANEVVTIIVTTSSGRIEERAINFEITDASD